MFDNCRKYNQPEITYYKCAKELEEYIKPHLKMLQDVENNFCIGGGNGNGNGNVNANEKDGINHDK